jgi:S-ribosylhomocysteine lyase LuxS involved in autoinducer biosynthesis
MPSCVEVGYNLAMSGKQDVQQVVDALPDEATLDDAIHALYLRAMLDRAEDDVRNGRVLSHEQAKKRLAKWLK